ncbi:hypothetical protein HY633_03335 [Candidatus Uhrbacteria bacterium]|nr:hypothetical protein [Candidatus Uhrbacteria bacterium]
MPKAIVHRKPKSRKLRAGRRVAYALVGFAVAGLLGGYGLWLMFPGAGGLGSKLGPATPPAPDFEAMIPEARFGSRAFVYDDDPVSPAFLVGYALNGRLELAVVAWDSRQNRYRLQETVALTNGSDVLGGPPAVMLEKMGPAGPTLVVASGPDAGTGWTMIFVRGSSGLAPAAVVEQDGTVRPGVFAIDMKATLEDISGDGVKELLIEQVDGGGVHLWDGRQFVWDARLTWALETRSRLFPEPENP